MHHRVDSPAAVRYSAVFPAFEADAMIAMIEREPLGEDDVADPILMNCKGADFAGHKYVWTPDPRRTAMFGNPRTKPAVRSAWKSRSNILLSAEAADR
jgi:hypothetical protein